MKLYDQQTQDLARVVQDVLEGKKVVKEMDPKDHVSKKGDKYVIVNKAGKEVKSFDSEDDANQYAKDNHDALMEVEIAYKKDRERLKDGSNDKKVTNLRPESVDVDAAHEEALAIEEARQLKDPKTEVMVVKNGKVEVINKKDLKKFMAKGYGLAEDDVKEEESDKQKKYQAFFDKALKKFGVKSPAELEGDKKKEFFDYVDANYEAENEED